MSKVPGTRAVQSARRPTCPACGERKHATRALGQWVCGECQKLYPPTLTELPSFVKRPSISIHELPSLTNRRARRASGRHL